MDEIIKWLKKIFSIQVIACIATIIGTYYGYKTYDLNKNSKDTERYVKSSPQKEDNFIENNEFKDLKDTVRDEHYNLLKKAESGDPSAQLSLGLAYYNGDGYERNYPEAVRWLIKKKKKNMKETIPCVMVVTGDPGLAAIWNDSCDKSYKTKSFRRVTNWAVNENFDRILIPEEAGRPPRFKKDDSDDMSVTRWISDRIKYPTVAKENMIEGNVICQFVVEKDGSVTNVKVVRPVDPSLDKEAVRVLKGMPKWIPGTKNGYKVRVLVTQEVCFKISL